ncbi:NAD(P)-dependent alcohol dehydrogenase [uncultured Microbacterium sp.]|uniref:NAD(P)-dependent alcohol dehydrogenase n=1 Tax=uncultured Microbacterium sp. TaxID=191216 RepID=UPI002616E02C|nr:NAD(P)-dependent alcohol dehydrogenase [uncultured Microbacterium sp.]
MPADLPETMRANVLVRAGVLELQERPVPRPAPDEVLVRVDAVGVCGSDVHFFHEGRLGDWEVVEPLVLGHESAGLIVAVGSAVDAGRVGQRVSIEPQHPSTTSRETLRGDYNLDPDMRFYAVPGTDGAFQEYVTIQSHFAHRVPDAVSDVAAALMEPLSVAVATIRKADISLGDRVLITGAGPIGMACAQVAHAAGAAEIVVTDLSETRRRNALRFGTTHVLDPRTDGDSLPGLQVDAFIDASGAGAAVRSGIEAVAPGGRVVLVGMGATDLELPITRIQNRELLLTGVFRYANTWPAAIALAVTGRVDLDGMRTGSFVLADAQAALESTADESTIKSVVLPQE